MCAPASVLGECKNNVEILYKADWQNIKKIDIFIKCIRISVFIEYKNILDFFMNLTRITDLVEYKKNLEIFHKMDQNFCFGKI